MLKRTLAAVLLLTCLGFGLWNWLDRPQYVHRFNNPATVPGEYAIQGERMNYDPGHFTFGQFDSWENRLLADLKAGSPPDEIYALLTAGYWGDDGQVVVRVMGDTARLSVYRDEGRFDYRTLSSSELQHLRDFIASIRADELAPLNNNIQDGLQVEYTHLDKTFGYRVFMNNPDPGSGASAYRKLVSLFRDLSEAAPLTTEYLLAGHLPKMQVLWSGKDLPICAVLGGSSELRIRLTNGEWRVFEEGKPGRAAMIPQGYFLDSTWEEIPSEMVCDHGHNREPWQVQAGEDLIRAGWGGSDHGLWRCRKNVRPKKITGGNNLYMVPLTTPDGKWVVAGKSDGSWAIPNYIVRIDLTNDREYRVNIPPADNFWPVAFIPAHRKFLLYRQNDRIDPEYYLLDPVTGESELIKGEIRPWYDQRTRQLQTTGRMDEVWAALPSENLKGATQIGRYNLRTFEFTRVAEIPEIEFSSEKLWVDEPAGRCYLAYKGDLLQIPLKFSKNN